MQESEANQERQAVAAAHRDAVLSQVYMPGHMPPTLLRPGDKGYQSTPGNGSGDGWGGSLSGRPPWKSVGGVGSSWTRGGEHEHDLVHSAGELIVASHYSGVHEGAVTAGSYGGSGSTQYAGSRSPFRTVSQFRGQSQTLNVQHPNSIQAVQQTHGAGRPQSPNPWTVTGRRPQSSSPPSSRPQSPNPWTESGRRPRSASPLGSRPQSPNRWGVGSTQCREPVSRSSRPRSPLGGLSRIGDADVWRSGEWKGSGNRHARPGSPWAAAGHKGGPTVSSVTIDGERASITVGSGADAGVGCSRDLSPERCNSPLLVQSDLVQTQTQQKRREPGKRRAEAMGAGGSAVSVTGGSCMGVFRTSSGVSSSGSLWGGAAGSIAGEEAAAIAAGLVSVEDAAWAAGLPRGLTTSSCCGLPDTESVNHLVEVSVKSHEVCQYHLTKDMQILINQSRRKTSYANAQTDLGQKHKARDDNHKATQLVVDLPHTS